MITTRRTANAVARFNKQVATDRQAEVWSTVISLRDRLHRTPSVREIADACGIHTSAAFRHLKALQRKRYIDWEPKSGRSLVIVKGFPLLGDVG